MGIRNLAQDLHLSIGTVSRALNDRPDVNPETRARVKAAAARTGYVPNQSGRSLRKGRTGIVAVVIPTGGPRVGADSGLFRVLEGTRRTLRRQSLDLIVLFRGPEEDALDNLKAIVQRRIADAMIISQTTPHDPRIAYMQDTGIDFVSFGRSAGVAEMALVDFDFETVAADAVRRFVRAGHRRLALVVDAQPMNYQDILAAAFRAEARIQGLTDDAVQILTTREARLGSLAREVFSAVCGARPTAILASHESICVGLYREFAELGLSVGTDVALVSTFPVLDAAGLVPSLACYDANLDAAGTAIGERLLSLLAEDRSSRRLLPSAILPVSFVPGASHCRYRELKITA